MESSNNRRSGKPRNAGGRAQRNNSESGTSKRSASGGPRSYTDKGDGPRAAKSSFSNTSRPSRTSRSTDGTGERLKRAGGSYSRSEKSSFDNKRSSTGRKPSGYSKSSSEETFRGRDSGNKKSGFLTSRSGSTEGYRGTRKSRDGEGSSYKSSSGTRSEYKPRQGSQDFKGRSGAVGSGRSRTRTSESGSGDGESTNFNSKYFRFAKNKVTREGSYSSRKRKILGNKNEPKEINDTNEIRLNRFIANSGICSRREADNLINEGQISVNGQTVTEMGLKVKPTDVVKYGNRVIKPEKNVYILLNKPKDFLTTTNDPDERRTVMELVKNACKERVYPVGRLDRNTTGLLLLTNDGELTEKLTHPSYKIKKVYAADLDKALSQVDFDAILAGISLEEGIAKIDSLAYLSPDRKSVGIELHIGWNRVVRRIFESLGYEVLRLDRVMYANLTKKDLPRGHYRMLTDKELIFLKHFKS